MHNPPIFLASFSHLSFDDPVLLYQGPWNPKVFFIIWIFGCLFSLVFVFCNIPPRPPHRLAWSGEKSPGDGGEKKKQKPTNCQLLEGRHNVSMTVPVLFLVAPKTRGPFFFSLCFIASLRHDCFFTFAFPQASFWFCYSWIRLGLFLIKGLFFSLVCY